MSVIKYFAKNWMRPGIIRMLRLLCRRGIRFEGDYESWEEALAKCSGYDADNILSKVLEATLKVKRGEAVFERDSVLFDEIEYAWPLLSGLMWAAARDEGRLNVLDFGGSLGSSYFQNGKFLQHLSEVRWNVVEQEHYVEAGRKHIADEQLRFYKTIEECLQENQPNVILLSSVIQYLKSPIEILNQLKIVNADCLLIDRTPFSDSDEDKLVVQNVPASIYEASYPMWIFSLSKFEHELSVSWKVVAKNISSEAYVRTKNGFNFSFQGMLLERKL
jgi:putative methyltransferase (TIGR04325 family)